MKKKTVAALISIILLIGASSFANATESHQHEQKSLKILSERSNVNHFSDVPASHWAYKSIMEMSQQQYIAGFPDGTFRPSDNIKREHVAVLLTRIFPAEQLKLVYPATPFMDVPENHPYAKQIQLVQQAGIFSGTDGKFRPNETITRAQLAKVLVNAFQLKVKNDMDFSDVPITHWANPFVRALASNGITTGSENKYKPNDPVTRAQMATFLLRGLDIVAEQPSTEEPESPIGQPTPEQPNPATITVEKFNESIKDNPLFAEGLNVSNKTFNNPFIKKTLIEGQELFKDTEFQYVNLFGGIQWNTPGYKNPKNSNFPQLLLEYHDDKTFYIRFDFRDEKATELATDLLELLKPNLGLKEAVMERAKEATVIEKTDPESFRGNRKRIEVGDYEIYAGVPGFLEFGDIYVHYIGE